MIDRNTATAEAAASADQRPPLADAMAGVSSLMVTTHLALAAIPEEVRPHHTMLRLSLRQGGHAEVSFVGENATAVRLIDLPAAWAGSGPGGGPSAPTVHVSHDKR